nr:uncharacterized protein LOC127328894 [Lolium perenne]
MRVCQQWADLRDDPAFTLTSYNWISFGVREFDACRRAGYLDDVNFFTRELDDEDEYKDDKGEYDEEGEYENKNDEGEYNDEDEEYNDEDDDEDEDFNDVQVLGSNDNDNDGGSPTWDPEIHPPDISEVEAIAITMANSKRDRPARYGDAGNSSGPADTHPRARAVSCSIPGLGSMVVVTAFSRFSSTTGPSPATAGSPSSSTAGLQTAMA